MPSVKPVEYIKDSSTQGFAVAGDEKKITSTTANTIKKDVDQGNTKDLDNAQERTLELNIDQDSLDYTLDENKNVGKNQIDTEGADKNSDGGVAAGTVVAGASAGAGILFAITTQTLCGANNKLGRILDGFSQAAIGGIMTALAAAALGLTFTFDKTLGDKENQTNQADSTNGIIQQYYDELTGNMDSMDEEFARYSAMSEEQCGSDMSLIEEIGAIQAQIIEYRAQGNEEKVAELEAQIEALKKGAAEDTGNIDGMNECKENLEVYASRNAEAQGVAESGTTVSDFLKQGHAYKGWAIANAVALGICSIETITSAGVLVPKVAPLYIDTVPSLAGKILFIAAGLLFAAGALRMSTIAKKEGDAGKAGDGMSGYVDQLNENIEAQAGYTDEIATGYGEMDAITAEAVAKDQEGIDKANSNFAGNVIPGNDSGAGDGGDGGDGDDDGAGGAGGAGGDNN